ncbi:hypothetical protein SGM_6392 [Streptomyces griseoaurantiacus M045]|uniref:Uncharacterized protein n=1 Tax=Streptomyces griseoaurantiacus M045 TaxID=996637 RepID=F3NTU2_9ACTN|nr:hypothetical protein SGM_6392 [Streptomyces griseoaurantiacus M045]
MAEALVAHPGAVQHSGAALGPEPGLAAAIRPWTVGHVNTPVALVTWTRPRPLRGGAFSGAGPEAVPCGPIIK